MEARTPPHERLREWRLKRELTQQALAELVGCGHAQICKIERKQQNPGRAIAVRLHKLTQKSGSPIRVEDWP
jgi:transcriptional regulator with XRE-family HTH domain